MQIRLTLVDSCVIHADARRKIDPVRVECSSGQPYLVRERLATGSPPVPGAHATAPPPDLSGHARAVTIIF